MALDSITTVVDAMHILSALENSTEAEEQVAFADQIILNKISLVSEAERDGIERKLRTINPFTPIYRADRAAVPLENILGKGSFDLERITRLESDSCCQPTVNPGMCMMNIALNTTTAMTLP